MGPVTLSGEFEYICFGIVSLNAYLLEHFPQFVCRLAWLRKNYSTDSHEILWRGGARAKEKQIQSQSGSKSGGGSRNIFFIFFDFSERVSSWMLTKKICHIQGTDMSVSNFICLTHRRMIWYEIWTSEVKCSFIGDFWALMEVCALKYFQLIKAFLHPMLKHTERRLALISTFVLLLNMFFYC